MIRLLLLVLLTWSPFCASAHSPLASLTPKDGASVQKPPTEINLTFKLPVQLIKVEMWRLNSENSGSLLRSLFDGGEGEKVTLNNNALRKVRVQHFINLPPLRVGNYFTKWRALGEDGHVIKGNFSFIVLDN